MKLYKIFQLILIALYGFMVIFFIYQCLKTGVQSSKASDSVAQVVADVEQTITHKEVVINDEYKITVRKVIGHFGYFAAFGIVSILLFLSIREIKYITIRIGMHYVAGIGFAFISEFLLEGNTSGRTASIGDVMLDSGGFISISTILVIVYLIIYFVKKKRENNDIQVKEE